MRAVPGRRCLRSVRLRPQTSTRGAPRRRLRSRWRRRRTATATARPTASTATTTTTCCPTRWRSLSDGDGILDGADDQDFDGWSNLSELSRAQYRVQPFNPCLPDYNSPTCTKHHVPAVRQVAAAVADRGGHLDLAARR
jgi:hypothetical protein